MSDQARAPTLTRRQKAWGWLTDYGYVAAWLARAVVARGTPEDLLTPPVAEPGPPVLLVPGVYENWRFLQPVGVRLYRAGHPVHVLDGLGWNTGTIAEAAGVVGAYLERLDLSDVTVIAHSKGGLIVKYALADAATRRRVRRLVAVNSPFNGSWWATYLPLPAVHVFAPRGRVIRELAAQAAANASITSLYSAFDPHIPETGHLDGAENVVLRTVGHFRPLVDPVTLATIDEVLSRPNG
ncbi:esterase/lipase family protein [uncultured Friedmanniella sp.]|uniref:esterase/lipase family protein n=1 Tax=uncultured Friedmanniella sp. TaxID=335381 RepID=UPI0035CC2456